MKRNVGLLLQKVLAGNTRGGSLIAPRPSWRGLPNNGAGDQAARGLAAAGATATPPKGDGLLGVLLSKPRGELLTLLASFFSPY